MDEREEQITKLQYEDANGKLSDEGVAADKMVIC